jgi:hypothetical protein
VDLDAYIDTASAMVNLPIAGAYRPGVALSLALAAEMAAVLDRVPLDDGELALAAVYTPPRIGEAGDA